MRWICPVCNSGTNDARERVPRDAVSRYCLPCSTKSGRLVLRTCPARDKAQAANVERTKRREAVARERAAARVAAKADACRALAFGIDVDRMTADLWAAALKIEGATFRQRSLPTVKIRKRYGTSYAYYGRHLITLARGSFQDGIDFAIVLAHEIAHLADAAKHDLGRTAHDLTFNRILRDLVRAVFGEDIAPALLPSEHGRGYAFTRWLEQSQRARGVEPEWIKRYRR